MLSVAIHKDVGEYQPKIVGRLTSRSLACTALAIGASAAVGAYCWFVLGLPAGASQYAVFAAALPIWAAGFWRPKGMTPEEFAPLWAAHALTDNRVLHVSTPSRIGLGESPRQEPSKAYSRLRRKKGVEAYSPTLSALAIPGGEPDDQEREAR